jgi:N-sulfoglucosamine sulfohydrolase
VKEYNENSSGSRHPMRAIETKRHLYIFNPWSNGKRNTASATMGTATYRRMKQLARSNAEVARRLDMFDHRVVEELYDVQYDPDCLKNLLHDPDLEMELAELRDTLDAWMVRTSDPMLDVFRQRENAVARESYMAQVEREAAERNAKTKEAKKAKKARENLQLRGSRAGQAERDSNRGGRIDNRARVNKPAVLSVDAEDR